MKRRSFLCLLPGISLLPTAAASMSAVNVPIALTTPTTPGLSHARTLKSILEDNQGGQIVGQYLTKHLLQRKQWTNNDTIC